MTGNPHIDTILNRNARSHEIEEDGDVISLSPLEGGDEEVENAIFQEFAAYVLKWNGHGYRIVQTHLSADHGEHDYDLIVVERTDRKKPSGT